MERLAKFVLESFILFLSGLDDCKTVIYVFQWSLVDLLRVTYQMFLIKQKRFLVFNEKFFLCRDPVSSVMLSDN